MTLPLKKHINWGSENTQVIVQVSYVYYCTRGLLKENNSKCQYTMLVNK